MQRYPSDPAVSTSWKSFSDNKFALPLAEQQEMATEQVGCVQEAIGVEDTISCPDGLLAQQTGDLAVRLGHTGVDEQLVDAEPLDVGRQLHRGGLTGDDL